MPIPVLIRIDVDSIEGIHKGVDFYLELFEKYGFKASFFVPMGPNNVVSAGLMRISQPAFWKQVYYMKPWQTYRLLDKQFDRNAEIGGGAPAVLKKIVGHGHEVALHGYDHAYISDNAYSLTPEQYSNQINRARDIYHGALGGVPSGTGSPAWRCDEKTLRVQDQLGFTYASDFIGSEPCRVKIGEYTSSTPQIPANLDNIFPLVVRYRGNHDKALDHLKRQIDDRGDYVAMTIHTEYEFVQFGRHMDKLFRFLVNTGRVGERYDCHAATLDVAALPEKELSYYSYDGAVGKVAATDFIGLLRELKV
ncbi:MAG: polysaccharide deacetylase family protein [Rhodospirillaceae bacterium]|nr:polysaccharide deacetylase family protein [Nitrospina sp.]MBT5244654.1 polysaccharide deacetylase family protein [Rhodospirillaceae bacterium]MBT5563564.1 polysaccharide deacetylase family protein [Rhodospirillaceae bacterium]MBT7137711.1 polysaccharide deacetylase family protein [Rhodospirillaceae bacterium]